MQHIHDRLRLVLALAAQGRFKEAAEKYAEAVPRAPHWGALHLHWGEALDKLGDRAKAIDQYHKAQELALSKADKLLVARYLSTAPR